MGRNIPIPRISRRAVARRIRLCVRIAIRNAEKF
jgi:hypothetical protein